jgi:hypothetical protein
VRRSATLARLRDATGNPGNPFPEVPGRFSAPHSPGNRICLPVHAPVPATIPRGPREATFLTFLIARSIQAENGGSCLPECENLLDLLDMSSIVYRMIFYRKIIHPVFVVDVFGYLDVSVMYFQKKNISCI